MFSFDYVPEDDFNKNVLLAEGDGFFKIEAADKKLSKAGNPMLVLTMTLKDSLGKTTQHYEYITANMAFKVHAILGATGQAHLYDEKGKVNPHDLLGCKGKCVIYTRKEDGYDPRSSVKRYVKRDVNKAAPAPAPVVEIEDDDLPF
jgi:hypothetical protein